MQWQQDASAHHNHTTARKCIRYHNKNTKKHDVSINLIQKNIPKTAELQILLDYEYYTRCYQQSTAQGANQAKHSDYDILVIHKGWCCTYLLWRNAKA